MSVAAAREGDAPQAEEPGASWPAGNVPRRQEQDVVPRALGREQREPGTRGCARMGCSQHTQGAQAGPGSRRLPGKCPKGRDGQGCAPCPVRNALPMCCQAQPSSRLWLLLCSCLGCSHCAAAVFLSKFTGLREFPSQLQESSTSLWDEEGAGS